MNAQIDSITIDGNLEFDTLSPAMYSDVTSFNSVFVSDKINNNRDNFRIIAICSVFIVSLFALFFNIKLNLILKTFPFK